MECYIQRAEERLGHTYWLGLNIIMLEFSVYFLNKPAQCAKKANKIFGVIFSVLIGRGEFRATPPKTDWV